MLPEWWWGLVSGWLKSVGALPTNGRGNTGLIWSKILNSKSDWASKTFLLCLCPLRRCHSVLSSSTYESVKSCEHRALPRWSIYFHSLHNVVLRGKKRSQHMSIMQPTFCIMSFCLHGLKQALWCNLCRASPALLCALELTDNICTAFWLFGEWKHTSSRDPGCVVGLVYQGRAREKLKMQRKSVKQANNEVGGSRCRPADRSMYRTLRADLSGSTRRSLIIKPFRWLQGIQSRWK